MNIMRSIAIGVGVLFLIASLTLSFVTASGSAERDSTQLVGTAELVFRFRYVVNFEIPTISVIFLTGLAGVSLGGVGKTERR